MMDLYIPRFGNISYEENQIITFKTGLFGFEKLKKYFIFKTDEESIFEYLQSIEDANITFIIAQPDHFIKDYVLDISQTDLELIKIKDYKNLINYVIITVTDKIENITANLQGPIIINKKTNEAKQVISLKDDYTTKHSILNKKE